VLVLFAIYFLFKEFNNNKEIKYVMRFRDSRIAKSGEAR